VIMELTPAWKKWGMEEERKNIIRKLLDKGFSPEEVAEMIELPLEDIKNLKFESSEK